MSYALGVKRLEALDIVDSMPGELRACVHEFGLPIVSVLVKHGIRKPNQIREIVKEIWLGPRQAGQNGGALGTLDAILARSPISSIALRRMLLDNNMVIVPTNPTRVMLEASMKEVTAYNVRVPKEEKHRLRLSAALRAAAREQRIVQEAAA